jgi:hypothetical protein
MTLMERIITSSLVVSNSNYRVDPDYKTLIPYVPLPLVSRSMLTSSILKHPLSHSTRDLPINPKGLYQRLNNRSCSIRFLPSLRAWRCDCSKEGAN